MTRASLLAVLVVTAALEATPSSSPSLRGRLGLGAASAFVAPAANDLTDNASVLLQDNAGTQLTDNS